MTAPPPLPAILTQPHRSIRIGLGVASLATIIAGQFVTKGALYGESFMGITFGVLAMITDLLGPIEGGFDYFVMLIFTLFTILLMIFIYAGLLLGLGTAIYIAVHRSWTPAVTRLVSLLFGSVAVFITAGLIFARSLSSRPEFHGEVHVESYFFIWPVLFAVIALLYAALFLNYRSA